MELLSYFHVSTNIKKVEPPYYRGMVDSETGQLHRLDQYMLVVAPREYPQLAEGLQIGAFYEVVPDSLGSSGTIYYLDSGLDGKYYFEWCEKLVELVTKGKRLEKRPYQIIDWSNKLSELVEDKQRYLESEGRGPFWELLRYGLRSMTFGPVICAKLAADFEKWATEAQALNDVKFYRMYTHMWSTFGEAEGIGMVTYPVWYRISEEPAEPKLGLETLALLESAKPPSQSDYEAGSVIRVFDDI